MTDNASEYVKIKYFSKCLGRERIQTNKCGGLKVGDVVEFDMEISVLKCPEPQKRRQTITIKPIGLQESLIIDLDMICSCGCETSGPTFELDSEICKRNGKLSCGICECYDGFFGRNCECDTKNLEESGTDSFNKCRPDNMTEIECSGRGTCICGQCACNTRNNPDESIFGKFCECDNFSCDRYDTKLCSGPEHGECACGVCSCKPGWEGNACECSTSKDECRNPLTGEECSGQGECKCNKCECKITNDIRYSGRFCEKCPTCPQHCELHKACVECQMYKKGPLKDPELCRQNCTFVPISVEDVECKLLESIPLWKLNFS
jgi:integrin beta 1